jgi:hypothetical protein
MNFPELRVAPNTKWNVYILEPREEIGRHCLPKDTKMFLESSNRRKSRIIRAAMEVDEDYRFPIYFSTLLAYNLSFCILIKDNQ